MKIKKAKSLDAKKSRSAFIFLSPWLLGMLLFFVIPIFQSFYYSFADISIDLDGVSGSFVGLTNIKYLISKDPDYIKNLIAGIKDMLISVPFILVVSLILAVLLNNKFKGRLFFRSLFFLPVIITSGVVLQLYLSAASGNATEVAVSKSVSFSMIDFSTVLDGLNLPASLETYLSEVMDNLFMLVWQSGIQVVLFIAGLQSIPDLLYEVSKVEGATKWEEFWFLTLPMLSRTMYLIIVFTIVENITLTTNPVIAQSYNLFNNLYYGRGSAALWLYFLIVGIALFLILKVYNKFFLERWE